MRKYYPIFYSYSISSVTPCYHFKINTEFPLAETLGLRNSYPAIYISSSHSKIYVYYADVEFDTTIDIYLFIYVFHSIIILFLFYYIIIRDRIPHTHTPIHIYIQPHNSTISPRDSNFILSVPYFKGREFKGTFEFLS